MPEMNFCIAEAYIFEGKTYSALMVCGQNGGGREERKIRGGNIMGDNESENQTSVE